MPPSSIGPRWPTSAAPADRPFAHIGLPPESVLFPRGSLARAPGLALRSAPTIEGPMKTRLASVLCAGLFACGRTSTDPYTTGSSDITHGSLDGDAHPAAGL